VTLLDRRGRRVGSGRGGPRLGFRVRIISCTEGGVADSGFLCACLWTETRRCVRRDCACERREGAGASAHAGAKAYVQC